MAKLHETYPALKGTPRYATPSVLQDELMSGEQDLILTQLPLQSADT